MFDIWRFLNNLFLPYCRDIAKYNTEDDLEESIEETGWKLVHGDVFRPPNNSRIFAAVIGSGIQLFCMMAITIFLGWMIQASVHTNCTILLMS